MNSGNLHQAWVLGAEAAERAIAASPWVIRGGRVSYSALASSMGVRFSVDSSAANQCIKGALSEARDTLPGTVSMIEIGANPSVNRRVVFHELAHKCLELFVDDNTLRTFNSLEARAAIKGCERRLRVPTRLLRDCVPKSNACSLDLEWILSTATTLAVPLTLLVERLGEDAAANLITLKASFMVVLPARSRRKQEERSGRIQAIVTPRRWFIPRNKRLTTLQANVLQDEWAFGELYTERLCYDSITIYDRELKSLILFHTVFTVKVFALNSGRDRGMIATFMLPDS